MELKLLENPHPNSAAESSFANLVGIDEQKDVLLNTLNLLTNKGLVNKWHKKYHKEKLSFVERIISSLPLVILAGDVGCGKTELANCIGSPLAKLLDKRVKTFETPSNIRGEGRVGDISNRITQAFEFVKIQLGKTDPGILIIDEADDLATSREQNQAHHEDRAGLNVLLKQIDLLVREGYHITVILITNRLSVLDPAVIRRAAQIILFSRPNREQRALIFKNMFNGLSLTSDEIKELVLATDPRDNISYTFSDLIQKIGKQSVYKAIQSDEPFSKKLYLAQAELVNPSPLIN